MTVFDLTEALATRAAWDGRCLLWQGARVGSGYAAVRVGGKLRPVTRLILAEQLGVDIADLPSSTHALHSCDRGADGCVTPEHIHPGSRSDNMREAAERKLLWQTRSSRCCRGHLLVEGNLVSDASRRCLVCHRARSRIYWRTPGGPLPTDMASVVQEVLAEDRELARVALNKEE